MTVDTPYFLSAAQASKELRVTKATLYAYASRGQLRSEPTPGQPRVRRYHREDVERLKERKESRSNPARVAASGLHWGSPVLDSELTLIRDGRIYYRGLDAVRLASTATLEDAAELLWAGNTEGGRAVSRPAAAGAPTQMKSWVLGPLEDSVTRFQSILPVAGADDIAAFDLRPAAVRETGMRILKLFATVVCGAPFATPIHEALRRAWTPRNRAAGDAIRAALVLCADHELNVSAFAARCAASAESSPYDVVSVGLATLKGKKHGGSAERVARLFDEADTPSRARTALASALRRGEQVPGFGHPLYPRGDPRATMLLDLAEASGNERDLKTVRSLAQAAEAALNDKPNLDFGLAAVTRAYKLPREAPLVLFALGRTVGWIAHAIEQYAASSLIRPRARYTGAAPEPI